MSFVNDHIETALETALESESSPTDVDVDDVHLVYRNLLILALTLSHAVRPSGGEAMQSGPEMLA
jgi:hypothetical protein